MDARWTDVYPLAPSSWPDVQLTFVDGIRCLRFPCQAKRWLLTSASALIALNRESSNPLLLLVLLVLLADDSLLMPESNGAWTVT